MAFPGIEKLISDLKVFNAEDELRNIVANNTTVIAEFIKKQLEAGVDGNDQPSTIFGVDKYQPATIKIKQKEGVGLGAVTDYVTNYMTGNFYASLKVDVEGNVFDPYGDISYFGDIKLYSSEAFLNVNRENRLEFAETITIPEMTIVLKQKTGLSINSG